jgi:prepilin-type processing-associated H-X9-DG protein
MMMPAVPVCEGRVLEADWSPDGRYLVIERIDPEINKEAMRELLSSQRPPSRSAPELVLWDQQTHRSMPIWKGDSSVASQVLQLAWERGSDLLLLSVNEHQTGSSGEDVNTLTAITVAGNSRVLMRSHTGLFVQASPTKPLAAIINSFPGGGYDLSFLASDGRISGPFHEEPRTGFIQWVGDGSVPLSFKMLPATQQEPKRPRQYFTIDPESGGKTLVADPNAIPKPSVPDPALTTADLRPGAVIPGLGKVATPTVVLAEFGWQPPRPKGRAAQKSTPAPDANALIPGVVSTDAEQGTTPDDGSAVFYVSQGVGMVRDVIQVPKDLYLKALEASVRKELINQAKQVALSMLMYSNDMDDNLPGHDGWQDQVQPYLMDGDLAQGFEYTYSGGSLTDVANPAQTELGFITGPGGRAVAYVDGHVKWLPNGQ